MEDEMWVKDLGILSGKILVFGGVYSNLQALEKLISIAQEQGIPPENILCTGDIVGYCAQPEECVQRIRQWGIQGIAGNVEIQLRNREADCGCNFDEGSTCDTLSQKWYPFAQSQLSEDSIEWMMQLPHHLQFKYGNQGVYVLHGSYANPSEFVFRSTPWDKKAVQFQETQAGIILAGHCGLPFHQEQDGQLWLNAGVIGMPANDGTPRVWYAILDLKENDLDYQHQCFEYDHETAARLMEQHQLPREYSKTLGTGIWDNCDILPQEETAKQGKRLELETRY
jgi:predicted phosphodiesterase